MTTPMAFSARHARQVDEEEVVENDQRMPLGLTAVDTQPTKPQGDLRDKTA